MSYFDEIVSARLDWPRAGQIIRYRDGQAAVPIHFGERFRLLLTDSREARELAVAATIAAQALEVEEGLTAGDRIATPAAEQESQQAGPAPVDEPEQDQPPGDEAALAGHDQEPPDDDTAPQPATIDVAEKECDAAHAEPGR